MGKILTVSVAAYNVASYIRQTLDSLIVPGFMDKLEVFIVDDGGTDGTLEIAKEYEAKYPDTFHAVHKENGGYGSTINYSVEHANGKYFKQLDGDDWFNTDTLAQFLNMLSALDTDCVYTQTIEWHEQTEDKEIVDHFPNLSEGIHLYSSTTFKKFLSMHATTIKTSILQDLKLHITEHCFYTDVEFVNLPVPYLTDFYVLHIPLYVYRIGREGQSVSTEGIKNHYKEHEQVFWKVAGIYAALESSERSKKQLIMCRLRREAARQLTYYCVLPFSKKCFEEMKVFYKRLRLEYPEIIKESEKNYKVAFLLFSTRCWAYPIAKAFYTVRNQLRTFVKGGGAPRA